MLRTPVILACVMTSLLLYGDQKGTALIASAYNLSYHHTLIPTAQTEDWVLLFEDNFDGESLNTSNWVTCYWWQDHWETEGCTNESINELQWYQPGNVIVDEGLLRIRGKQEDIFSSDVHGDEATYRYTSGLITSGRATSDISLPPRFAFQYGYAEIKARVPRGRGLWSAFWLLPTNHDSRPEIDVMEILGQEPNVLHMFFHHQDGSPGYKFVGPDFSADWHTFGVDWQPDRIIWYVDRVERWRYEGVDKVPDTPMYLLINLAIGGDWAGSPDSSTVFPSYLEVDYVRVWQRSS